jgi:phage FluMu protein Com
MQIRCYNCHKPFAMNKQAIHEALDIVMNEGLNHYNAYCPHCRRANRVSTDELRRWAPDWGSDASEPESG